MKKNIPILKYNDLKYLMALAGDPFDGVVVDDASLSVMLRIEETMQRLCPMGNDDIRWLWIEIKAPDKRCRMESADNNGNYWYELSTARYKDFHYMVLRNRGRRLITLQSAKHIGEERKPDPYYGNVEQPLLLLEKYVNALVDWICEDAEGYNAYVENHLPYSKRCGRIRRSDLNRICPVYKTFERPDLVVSVLKRMKSLPLWMIEKMTLRTYMHVWRIAYEAYRTKDSFEPDKPMAYHGLTDESIFISHNSKGREIENYDLDSEEGYLAWDKDYSPYHCNDVAYARIHLIPRKNEGYDFDQDIPVAEGMWYFELSFSVYGYSQDVVNIFEALSDAGIGVLSYSAERLYKMASETDWVSISPVPNKYTYDDEIGNEISLPSVSDDITEELVNEVISIVEWEPEQKVKPIKKE